MKVKVIVGVGVIVIVQVFTGVGKFVIDTLPETVTGPAKYAMTFIQILGVGEEYCFINVFKEASLVPGIPGLGVAEGAASCW